LFGIGERVDDALIDVEPHNILEGGGRSVREIGGGFPDTTQSWCLDAVGQGTSEDGRRNVRDRGAAEFCA
jgi:hypothetical protein